MVRGYSWIPASSFPLLPQDKAEVSFIRRDVLPSDSIQGLFLLDNLKFDPVTLTCLSLASPHRTERDLFVGRIRSLEPRKGLGIGLPLP